MAATERSGVLSHKSAAFALLCTLATWLTPATGAGLSAPTVRWQTAVEGPVSGAPVRDADRLYVGDRDGRVYALSTATGTEAWRTRVAAPGSEVGPLARAGGYLYAPAGDQVAALRPADGAVVWSSPFRGLLRDIGPATPPLLALPDGLLVSDSLGTRLLGADGTQRWQRPEANAAVVVADGTLYLNGGDQVSAVTMEDGATLWATPLGAWRGRSLRVDGDRVYLTALFLHAVIALDRRDGSQLWRRDLEVWDWLDLLDAEADRIYLVENRDSSSNSSDIGRLVILSAATGQVLVRAEEGPNIDLSSFALDGTLFLGRSYGSESLNGSVTAVGGDGIPRWSVSLPRAAQVRLALGDVTGGDAVLYAGDGAGGVYGTGTAYLRALALAGGAQAWRLPLEGNLVYLPVVDGTSVYAATDAGHVYAVCGSCPVDLAAVVLSAPGLSRSKEDDYRLRMEAGGELVLQAHPPNEDQLPGDVILEASAQQGWMAPPRAPGQLRYLAPAAATTDTLRVRVQQERTDFERRLTVVVDLAPVRDERLRWRAVTQGQVIHVWSDSTRLYAADWEKTDAAGNPGSSGLYAFDPDTGALHWRLRLPDGAPRTQQHGGVIYVSLYARKEGSLWAVRAADGQVLWRTEVGRGLTPPVVGGGAVYVGSGDTIAAFDAATGLRRWALNADAEIGLFPQRLRLAGPRLLADGYKDPLLAVRADDGDVLWAVDDASGLLDNGPVAAAGRAFGMDDAQRLFARDQATGDLLWTAPGVTDARYLIVVGDTLYHGGEGELMARRADDGSLLWHTTDPVLDFQPPVVHGGLLFTTSPAGFPAAYARRDGQPVWQHPDEPGFSYFVLDRRTLYLLVYPGSSTPRQLRALDAATGAELWRYEDVSRHALGRSWTVDPAGRRMYFGADAGYVAALTTALVPGTAVHDDTRVALPAQVSLGPNYPNPCNPATTIPFELPAAGPVKITLYDILGQRILGLVDGERATGRHEVRWDGRDAGGAPVAAGVYLYALQTPRQRLVRRLAVLP